MNTTLWIPLTGLVLLSGCSKGEKSAPDAALQQFARVYAGYMAVCTSDSARVERRAAYLQEELTRNKMTLAQYAQMRTRLEANPQEFARLLELSDEILQKKGGTLPAAADARGAARRPLP